MKDIRQALLNAGVQSLREFGYPSVNVDNILTDTVYSIFFKKQLEELRQAADAEHRDITEIDKLIKEIQ